MTYADLGRINEADSTALPKAASQKTTQRHQATLHQLNKAVVADSTLENSTADASIRDPDNST
ncbi:hypothetical protein [Nitrosomonas sp. Nm58]|uniref:hypothetical protein n=1 Tax=Nitrosomonas sp. Nm58 TaxID=200126 RepID=UPI00210A26FE|nr:hypothetical protein [Nitrosomonas sp. Nm58]